MPTVIFQPSNLQIEVAPDTKILVAATKIKAPIRYGCAACSCGTCAVRISGNLNSVSSKEEAMLIRLGHVQDGTIRMACQARVLEGECVVDLSFQDEF